ncbi:hypothetical protein IU486_31265 [Streptomyces gardneri]|uniref:hypothetical protein n=1 Tax=Nocardia abscessus TaxID=120957 RepID=UPI00189402E7|nr:hypothetical protein [Nocardia abscessus]MBF6169183.1 hypothetical protein [Streptomyces gardneri]MBF6475267.1 hypothetical protein [Nocardia abscessus]
MFRRLVSRMPQIAVGVPRPVHALGPHQRVLVLVLVFVFYLALTVCAGVPAGAAIGLTLILGAVAGEIVGALDCHGDVRRSARA